MHQTPRARYAAAVACAVALTTVCAAGSALHVDDDAPPGGDGSGWATAYRFLRDALGAATAGTEIRVAVGTYRPDRSEAAPTGTLAREAVFTLQSGVALRGGYAGLGAADPDDRDVAQHPTILSGDLLEDDESELFDDNSYHVVIATSQDETAVLDGFHVVSGNANGASPFSRGGGTLIDGGGATITSCVFRNNRAVRAGALAVVSAAPVVSACVFRQNRSSGNGGAVDNDGGAPEYIDCCFVSNRIGFGAGGAMHNNNSSPVLTRCTFVDNFADDLGGAVANGSKSSPIVTDSAFIGNVATCCGGAMWSINATASPIIDGCRFERNVAGEEGGALLNQGTSLPVLSNSLFCENDPEDIVGGWDDQGGNVFNGTCCPADIDGNGDVGFGDLTLLLAMWGACPGCAADLDGSCDVGFRDLTTLLAAWGACP